jgi:sugar (pentulose or hexulose) kinase
VGIYADARAACRQTARWAEEVIHPIPENAALYDDVYAVFCQLYPALSQPMQWKESDTAK